MTNVTVAFHLSATVKCELVVLDSEGHVCDDVCQHVTALLHEKQSFGV